MRENGNRLHRSELRLRGAIMHPARIGILDYLATDRGGVSAEELAAALDLTVSQVRYHLKVLGCANLIAQVDEEWAHRAGGGFYVAAVT